MTALPIVYDGVRQPDLDIVSIPGLPTLNPYYKPKDHNVWLREVLSHQVPRARIMAFQYDFGKNDSGRSGSPPSWTDLLSHVEKLLYALVHRREGTKMRPLVFVCYSFGAFILKKALLVAKESSYFYPIIENTGGIVFLGCLNDERPPDLVDLVLKCAAVEFNTNTKHNTIGSLKNSDWDMITNVMEGFRTLPSPFPVRILYELKETNIPDRLWIVKTGKPEQLCSERMSSLGWETERLIGVQKDHAQLAMYPDRADHEGFFRIFMDTMSELVNLVSPPSADSSDLGSRSGASSDSKWSLSLVSASGSTTSLPLPVPGLGNQISLAPAAATTIPCFILHPYEENPNFVGRKDVHDEIHKVLNPWMNADSGIRRFALTGLGGMGKTQMAISYACSHRDVYQVVLLAHSDGQSKLAESFHRFAAGLGLGDGLTQVEAKTAVKDYLRSLDIPWLLIFDNADRDDKQELLREFSPEAGCGSILITSRDQTMTNVYPGLCLGELDEASAVDLLFKLTPLNRSQMPERNQASELSAARQVVKKIGGLPLGISQAAVLIRDESLSMEEFLEAYSLRELIHDCEEIDLTTGTATYKYSLRTVWNMSFERLDEAQKELLMLLSFLDPDRIQMQLLRNGASKVPGGGLAFVNTSYKLNKARKGLLLSSLVSQSDTKQELRMHRLVGASCQLRMTATEREKTFKNAFQLIKELWPVPQRSAVHNPSLWEAQRALLPHAQKLCETYIEFEQKGMPLIPETEVNWDFASMMYEAGWFCYESGLLHSAPELFRLSEKYCLFHLNSGGGYRILADVYGGLGSCDTETNQFQGAYDNFESHYRYVQLALDHGELERPSIWEVFSLGRLGNGNHGLHRYAEAESYYKQCLAAWEGLPGDRKIFTTHLATCLWLQGRLEEAEAVVRPIIKDENDTSNFRTAMAMYSLGNILIAQADEHTSVGEKKEAETKYKQAMDIHTKVLVLWTKTLGARHHKTADAFHKMGWHWHRMNQYEKAAKMYDQALDIYNEHPHLFSHEIARTKYKMGCLYQDVGNSEEGSSMIREAEKLRQGIVPPEQWEPAVGERAFDEIVQFWTR